MKKCLREKCDIEFKPTKPKQQYCSNRCRTYAYREKRVQTSTAIKKAFDGKKVKNLQFDKSGQFKTPKTLDQLRVMCPPELKGMDKSEWVRVNRQKYNI